MTNENRPEFMEDGSEVFSVDKIRELIELMKDHDLSEIDLQHKPRRIRLRRGGHPATPVGYSMPLQAPATPVVDSASGGQTAPADDANITLVKSPMVGTFYNRPKPEEPTFVKIGEHVEADTIVCLIEAMKMFNEIPSGVSGTIVELLAKNEEPVDVGRPLFKVKTN